MTLISGVRGWLRSGLPVVLAVLLVSSSRAQTNNILHRFNGGHMDITVSSNSQLMTGPGIRSVSAGGVAPVFADVFSVFRNPAGLRYTFDRPRVGFTFKPKLGIDFSLVEDDMQKSINEQMDEAIKDFDKRTTINYPTFSGGIYQQPGVITSLAMTFPKYPWQFGIGYNRPFVYDLDFRYGGLNERLEAVPESDNGVPVNTMFQVKFDLNLVAKADVWTAVVARDVGTMWTMGASISRNFISIDLHSSMDVDGMMIMSGEAYAFNDPSVPWDNTLQGLADGVYDGESWTLHLGTQFVPWAEDGWRFGADLKLVADAELSGNMPLYIDEFPAMKLITKEGEDNFDVNRIAELSELTRTYRNYYLASSTMKLRMPSSWTVGFSRAKGWRPNIRFTKYMGKIGFELDVQEKSVEDTLYSTNTFGRGIIPHWEAYLGIHPGHLFMGWGVIMVEDYVLGYKDANRVPIKDGTVLPLPRYDLGFDFNLTKHMKYEVLLEGIPEEFLRMGITYEF